MASQIRRPARAALVEQAVEDLNRRGAAFIRDLDRQEPRMVQIAREFEGRSAEPSRFPPAQL
ncbi:unnamed protein product [Tetraodon nigroviridis]|uniref:(spotted green pufferfish) hypothetical protein n=1 Tax=Tetraodon nigroviridis TaxID=99883 RepID=Q4S6D2_TETNG|nr:unnamed protein product [Tetraodon nigroviridis]